MMKLINLFILSIFLFGCNISKSVTTDMSIVETTKSRYVDTTLKVINPIKAVVKKDLFFDTTKIETKYFTVKSYTNYSDNTRVTQLIPKKDSIEVKVKVKENVTSKKTDTKVKVNTSVENSIEKILGFGFLVVFHIIFCYLLIKRIMK